VSDLLPRLAGHVDDMAFIHSMQSKTAVPGPAMFMANSGFILPGFPSMGAWVTYGLVRDHGYWGPILDGGAAGLLADLKAHGMLDSTLVMCQTEFGRQPGAQGKGRDHNAGAFTVWMAGGGIKGGTAYGTSDELGFKAEENPTFCSDLHATALKLLGIDHTKLSVYNNGIQRRLTDVHGHVIDAVLT